MHRLGVALVEIAPLTPGRRIAREAGRAAAVLAALALAAGLAIPLLRLGELGMADGMAAVGAAAAAPPAAWVLAPFQALMAPWYAASTGAWLASFALVVGVLALHTAWV